MADGCGFSSLGGNPSGSGVLPTYSTAYEIDFTAQPSASIVAGQNVLTDGTSWTGENVASAATFRFTNGQGLEFAAGGTTQWTSAGLTAAALWISLNDTTLAAARRVIPTWDANRQYIFQLYNPLNNGNAATEIVYYNLYGVANVPYTGAAVRVAGSCKGGNATVASGVGMTTQTGTPVLIGDYAADNVISMTPTVGSPSAMMAQSGVYSGGWPSMPSLRECGWISSTATPAAPTAVRFTDGAMRLCIAFPTGNSSATFTATVARLRVLVKN